MMNNSEHKPSENNVKDGIDRLSELSDEILLHILSFLPIADAVRTMSIRRFGKLWTLLPSLQFDDRCGSLIQSVDPEEYDHHFINFVRSVLVLHNKTFLDKFFISCMGDLDCMYDNCKSLSNEMMTWLGFAIDRQVKELIVNLNVEFVFHVSDKRSILPRGVLASQSLVTLNLSGVQINEPSQVYMGSLKTLSLNFVKVTDEVIKKIVSGSPSLQQMHLSNVIGLNELRFTAPNIQELHLTRFLGLLDCPNLKILHIALPSLPNSPRLELLDVSSVHEACIKLTQFDVFYDLLKKLCHAEVFSYSDSHFESSRLKKLDFPQTSWKRLHINSRLDGAQLLSICDVLRSSPHLEELKVIANAVDTDDPRYSEPRMLSLEVPPCSMQQLKTVTLHGYAVPCHGLLKLAEFLLKNSVTLEEMVILLRKNNSASVVDVLMYEKKLSSFPRASTNARVIVGLRVLSWQW